MIETIERTPVTIDEIKVSTVASKVDYRVILRENHAYRFIARGDAVFIYTKSSNLGGYALERFGGELTPAGIRKFITENVRL